MQVRIALTCVLAVATLAAANAPKTYTGQISDSQCAMNVHSKTHSHSEMLQGGHMGKDPSECAKMCVHDMGGAYVLLTNPRSTNWIIRKPPTPSLDKVFRSKPRLTSPITRCT